MTGAPDNIPQELIAKLTRDEGDFFDDYSDGQCFLIRNRLLEEKTGLILDSMSCEFEKNSMSVVGAVPLKAVEKHCHVCLTGYNDKGRVIFHETAYIDGASFEAVYLKDNISKKLTFPIFIKVIPIKI
jgi:hypothetical protein